MTTVIKSYLAPYNPVIRVNYNRIMGLLDNNLCRFIILRNRNSLIRKGVSAFVSCLPSYGNKQWGMFNSALKTVLDMSELIKRENKRLKKDYIFVLFVGEKCSENSKLHSLAKRWKSFVIIEIIPNKNHSLPRKKLIECLSPIFPIFKLGNNPVRNGIYISPCIRENVYPKIVTIMELSRNGSAETVGSGTVAEWLKTGDGLPLMLSRAFGYSGKRLDTNLLEKFVMIISDDEMIKTQNTYCSHVPTGVLLNEWILRLSESVRFIVFYQISYFLFYEKELIESQKKKSLLILSEILGPYDSGDTIESKLKLIDKHTYRVGKNKITSHLTENFCNIIARLLENKEEWLSCEIMMFINKNLNSTISATVIFNFRNGKFDNLSVLNKIMI